MKMQARLQSPVDIAGFRTEARQLLANQVPPEDVTWTAPAESKLASSGSAEDARPRVAARAASSIVPASFLRLSEYVVQHRDPDRFSLLYRLLWRLVHEPNLRHDPTDRDMARAQHMAHAVRRDIHKVKANLRFLELDDADAAGGLLCVAYCEPAHHVIETVAPWMAKRYAAQRWALFTPGRSAYWDGRQLHYGPSGADPLTASATAGEWLERWRQIFGGDSRHRTHAG